MGWPRRLRHPALAVVLLAAGVHVVRRNVVDIVVFLAVAALIAVEPRLRLSRRARPAWLDRRAPALATAGGLALVVGLSDRTSAVVQVMIAGAGVAALLLVVLAGPGGPDDAEAPRWWVWAVVLVAGSLLELGDFLSQVDPQTDNLDHPTLSGVLEPLLADAWVRAAAAGAWLLVGWWLVRLTTQRRTGSEGQ